jgi:type II secretion system protein H
MIEIRRPRRPQASSGSRPRSGFTLLEVSLVLLIMAVVLTFVMPRLGDRSAYDLRSEARRLKTTFRFLRSEAALNGRIYLLHYDIDQGRYWITSEDAPDSGDLADGAAAENELGLFARPNILPKTIAFNDIVLPIVGKMNQGQMFTRFYPDGNVDPTVIHLTNGPQAMTVMVIANTGQTTIHEGYRDFEYQ